MTHLRAVDDVFCLPTGTAGAVNVALKSRILMVDQDIIELSIPLTVERGTFRF